MIYMVYEIRHDDRIILTDVGKLCEIPRIENIEIIAMFTKHADALAFVVAKTGLPRPQRQRNHANGKTFPVRCNETGKVYDNISAAAREIGVSRDMVNRVVNGKKGYPNVRGLTFSRLPRND